MLGTFANSFEAAYSSYGVGANMPWLFAMGSLRIETTKI